MQKKFAKPCYRIKVIGRRILKKPAKIVRLSRARTSKNLFDTAVQRKNKKNNNNAWFFEVLYCLMPVFLKKTPCN